MPKVAASVLSADFARLEQQIGLVEEAGADMIHVDIMDGHFVPAISFGPSMVKTLRRLTDLPLQVHLMVVDPDRYIDECVDSGAHSVTVHVESTLHPHRSLAHVRRLGIKAGIALNPGTALESIEWLLPECDSVTLMSVNPGFGGQKFISSAERKIRSLTHLFEQNGFALDIVVDGGINDRTAAKVICAGATILVAGSYVFGHSDMRAAIDALKNAQ